MLEIAQFAVIVTIYIATIVIVLSTQRLNAKTWLIAFLVSSLLVRLINFGISVSLNSIDIEDPGSVGSIAALYTLDITTLFFTILPWVFLFVFIRLNRGAPPQF